jgi:hypothetical protein
MMLIIAIVAICIPMLAGISGLVNYRISKDRERRSRDNASLMRQQGGGAKFADEWERACANGQNELRNMSWFESIGTG